MIWQSEASWAKCKITCSEAASNKGFGEYRFHHIVCESSFLVSGFNDPSRLGCHWYDLVIKRPGSGRPSGASAPSTTERNKDVLLGPKVKVGLMFVPQGKNNLRGCRLADILINSGRLTESSVQSWAFILLFESQVLNFINDSWVTSPHKLEQFNRNSGSICGANSRVDVRMFLSDSVNPELVEGEEEQHGAQDRNDAANNGLLCCDLLVGQARSFRCI